MTLAINKLNVVNCDQHKWKKEYILNQQCHLRCHT